MKKMPLSGHGGALVLLLGVLAVSCAGRNGALSRYNGPDAETIAIGAVYPASRWDNDHYLREALELAVRQINEAGGGLAACCACGYFCIFIQKYLDLRAAYAV